MLAKINLFILLIWAVFEGVLEDVICSLLGETFEGLDVLFTFAWLLGKIVGSFKDLMGPILLFMHGLLGVF